MPETKYKLTKKRFKENINDFLIAIAGCLAIGMIGAFIVTFDGPGWISFIAFGFILLFVLIPIVLILLVASFVKAIQEKAKHSLILVTCAILLPVSFFGSIILLDKLNLTRSDTSESNDIRPVGSELDERIVIAFKETASWEEIDDFDKTALRKTIPQPNGILLEFADGVCTIFYPDTEFKYKVADVGFCNDATDEQKKKIRDKVNSSKLIYKVFENLRMEDIGNLPLEKKKVDKETQENKKELKTVENSE